MSRWRRPNEPSRARAQAPRGLRPALLLGFYVALGLAPLALAALQGLPARNPWRELSSGLAMVGFAMMLLQFLLSGRFERVSGRTGIDVTMRFHQLIAWTILAFILVHPFLYAAPRLSPDPAAAWASLQRMFAAPGLRTGVVAWALTVLIVAMAAWRDRLPFRYEAWRLSHGLGAAAVALLAADHTLRAGTYAADPWLTAFWLVLTAIAIASLAYVYAIKPLRKRRAPYRVVANDRVADRMWQIVIEPQSGQGIDFAAGQFGWLNLGHSPFSLTEHPFSIATAPADGPRLGFVIKESGDFTDRIDKVPVGTAAYFDGPHGNFSLAGRTAQRIVFIAGGVGFAPILGILRELRREAWPHPIVVVYGNRVETQILCRDELETMRGALKLDLKLVLSEPPAGWTGPVGELTADVLRSCIGPVDGETLYFVCGPSAMMDAVEGTLAGFGVPGRRIVAERFKFS